MANVYTKKDQHSEEELCEIIDKMIFVKECMDDDGLMKLIQDKAKEKAKKMKSLTDIKVAYNNLFKPEEELPKKRGKK